MTIALNWPGGQKETFRYSLANHRLMTALFARMILGTPPRGGAACEHQTIRYTVEMDYGKLGTYHMANTATDAEIMPVMSNVVRPLLAMLNNPFGPQAPRGST